MKLFYKTAAAALFAMAATTVHAQTVKVPEGTEVVISVDDKLSSDTSHEGDRFTISLADDVVLADGGKLPAGLKGAGEVTHAKKKGMMGKPGELNVRFDYLKVGDAKIKLRGQKGAEGDARYGTTITLTVLFGPLGLIKHGKDVEIKPGQKMTIYTDADASVELSGASMTAAAPAAAAAPTGTAN
ncbi:hypothetical protein [Caulobacter sp. UNC279MFTsu5.1]|uniref:hypothetical protein n=1 Tax=Caulobacter sp. UNC279MFTsu5.1 TaxID=1502775 RepID=UPI00036C22ED|nr:hypothetical protein [Caulobacter sp. UNC279MFTsu5.1]SFI91924.1 hypothetical protein SAMN02799626_00772 [Caulobacter sp. UNC279MFTsu5.1]